MSKQQETQQQFITTSTGFQCVAVYAGNFAGVKYYECSCPLTNNFLGYTALVANNKYGPLCKNTVTATIRARNIAERSVPWWTKLFEFQR